MDEQLVKPSDLKKLLNFEEKGRYEFKCFLNKRNTTPNIVFKDRIRQTDIIAKFIYNPSNSEVVYWPRIHHDNLNPLLWIITVSEKIKVCFTPSIEKNLRNVISSKSFIQHPKCFERKVTYAKGILNGIQYLHQNYLCLLNLCIENIYVRCETDQAIIENFSCLSYNHEVEISNIQLRGTMAPPELSTSVDEVIEGFSIDIWSCGIAYLQMFTNFFLPITADQSKVLDGLTINILNKVNYGSNFTNASTIALKKFLSAFLDLTPNLRVSARDALKSDFLCRIPERLDKEARKYWEQRDSLSPAAEGKALTQKSLTKNQFIYKDNVNFHKHNMLTGVIEKNSLTRKKSIGRSKTASQSRSRKFHTFKNTFGSTLNQVVLNNSVSCPSLKNFPIKTSLNSKQLTNKMHPRSVKLNASSTEENVVKKVIETNELSCSKSCLDVTKSTHNASSALTEQYTDNKSSVSSFNHDLETLLKNVKMNSFSNESMEKYSQNLNYSNIQRKGKNLEKPTTLKRTFSTKNEAESCQNGGYLHNVWYPGHTKYNLQSNEKISSMAVYDANEKNTPDFEENVKKKFLPHSIDKKFTTTSPPFTVIVTDCPRAKKGWISKIGNSFKNKKEKKLMGTSLSYSSTLDEIIASSPHDIDIPLQKPMFSAVKKKKRCKKWRKIFCSNSSTEEKN